MCVLMQEKIEQRIIATVVTGPYPPPVQGGMQAGIYSWFGYNGKWYRIEDRSMTKFVRDMIEHGLITPWKGNDV